ncbi:MAG: hypothetical protein P4L99_19780 [Chthoniobacter sp.]|nr:hypothetical protein [Chthoniobacter sp.]
MIALATPRPPDLSERWRLAAFVTSAAVIALGLVVLIGWYAHYAPLVQIVPGLAAMQYNTALCFVLCGLALGA